MLRLENLPLSEQSLVLEKIKKDPSFRVLYCEHDFKMFCISYFGNLMTHGIPDFHDNYYDWAQMEENLCLLGFRGCAKTGVFGLMYIVWSIVYKKESFIIFLAFNKTDAAGKVRNIITALKTNVLLTQDFGFLFEDVNSGKKSLNKMPESKSVSKFITTNSIRVEAFSMDQSARGFVFFDDEGNYIRPSLVVADDIAVKKNSRNKTIVDKDFEFLTEELFGGVKGRIIFLLNAISEYSLPTLLKKQFENKKGWIFNEKAIIENGKLTWPHKYVWTEKEAEEYNKGKYKRYHVESIEKFKSRGEKAFNTDYMNVPEISVGESVFDIDLIEQITPIKPIRVSRIKVNGKVFVLNIYKDIKRVSAGVDVANGGGGDNSSITLRCEKGSLVAQGASNEIEPYELAHILKSIHYNLGFVYFKNALTIEKNNSGIAVIQELRHDKYIYKLIYRKRDAAKVGDTPTNEVGFPTTGPSKELLKGEIDKRIQNKNLELCEDEKHEMMRYIYEDDGSMGASSGEKDDRVISCGLSFMGLLYKKD